MVDDLHYVADAVQRRSSDDFEFEDRHKPLNLFGESSDESPTRLRLSSFDDYEPRQRQETVVPEQPAESCCGGNKEDEIQSQSTDQPSHHEEDEDMTDGYSYNDDDLESELGFGVDERRTSDQF